MTTTIQKKFSQYVRKVILQQVLLAALMAMIFAVTAGKTAMLSSLYAGGICCFTNAYFAKKVFFLACNRQGEQVLNGFYMGEVIKLLSTGILFAIVMKYGKIHPFAFFVTLIVIHLGYFMMLLLQKQPTQND